MSLTFSVICIKIISCFPSPCTGLSPAQTTTEAPLPCRIFIGLYLIALRRSDLGNPRLRYNNMAMIDYRIWLPPVTAYCGCAVICSCLYYTTLATEVLRYKTYWVHLDYHSISLDFILVSICFISPFSCNLITNWLMAFQRAILPAVLSWADKLVMIGKYWNTYLIACQCYIYYIAYTGAPS